MISFLDKRLLDNTELQITNISCEKCDVAVQRRPMMPDVERFLKKHKQHLELVNASMVVLRSNLNKDTAYNYDPRTDYIPPVVGTVLTVNFGSTGR